MQRPQKVSVIIPALNEERNLPHILQQLGRLTFDKAFIHEVIVCDNGSTDDTAHIVEQSNAVLAREPERGYGAACLAAIKQVNDTDILLFLNADGAEDLSEAHLLIRSIQEGADLAVGSRALGPAESGALYPHQKAGNRFAVWVMNALYGTRLTDLGPFRAIRYSVYQRLRMKDRDFGWIIEMQLKCLNAGYRIEELGVRTKKTLEPSKISGTLRGSIGAATKILSYLSVYCLKATRPAIQRFFLGKKTSPEGRT